MVSVCRSIPTALPLSTTSLKKIEDDGTWTELWQIASATVRATPMFPELPEIGAWAAAYLLTAAAETIWKRMMRFIAVNCFPSS